MSPDDVGDMGGMPETRKSQASSPRTRMKLHGRSEMDSCAAKQACKGGEGWGRPRFTIGHDEKGAP